MDFTDTKELKALLHHNIDTPTRVWLDEKLHAIIESASTKDLYLTYSLLAHKIDADTPLDIPAIENEELHTYLSRQNATTLQMARLYLLSKVLEEKGSHFQPKVANLIQIADSGELASFLKFLILLPNPEDYKHVAVEALRTNIATVFNAISADNPYPAQYFNDQQWNQMYLKAAFMQQDLSRILDVDTRANADLARIISDYAHERWAASREVDPLFWRPVGGFLTDDILKDMERLLQSDHPAENRAGALCCFRSNEPAASDLLEKYPELREGVANGKITWSNLKEER
ncbi:MAG TPA: EboA domain-containing protein [Pricia sp.]|nr:EboA domain-containing protein [Pricia sp.]